MAIVKTHGRFDHYGIPAATAALLLTISSPTLVAQEVNNAVEQNDTPEIIEVTGVRSSLENALNVKRSAASIVDAISANDIDALPALDLGEALQAIPGVQLNSDQEGRQSSISLRGLGGGFVKTTAFGQSFSTPSAASNLNAVGSPNPFAAYEPSVFDGVTVVKSPTADLQEGGVAGIVDQKLQQALSKGDGNFNVSLGGRYEELTGKTDPNIRLSGVKHIIEDKLAVAFKIAASGQTFRRDTFDIIDYTSVDDDGDDVRAVNVAEYRERWGIPENAQLTAPGRARNVSEFSDGNRVSMTGNIEYRMTDDLKFGAHILFSERNLDDGTKEATTFSPGFNTNRRDRDNFDGRVILDLETAPFAYDRVSDDPDAGQVFAVTDYDFTDGSLQNENRKTTFQESSEGIILYADYAKDDWIIDGVLTHSEAENNFENIGINFVHNQDWRNRFNFTDVEGRRNVESVPTGFNGTINGGQGDLGQIVVSGGFDQPYVYDDLVWSAPTLVGATISSVSDANQGRRLNFGINGRVRDLTRDLSSAEFSAQRYTDFGLGDAIRFETIKFGARFSSETLDSVDQRQAIAGINVGNISNDLRSFNVLSATQNAYFNGNVPGTFDNTNGWVTFDNDATIAALQDGIITNPEELVIGTGNIPAVPALLQRNRSGFWDQLDRNTGLPSNIGFNFDAQQDILAMYLTSNFSGALGPVEYTGNIGVRHVQTDNTFNGFETQVDAQGRNGVAILTKFEDDYNHTLPMMNVAFELHDDVVLRFAYYEGIVRPNLLSQRPTATLRGGATNVNVTLPTATVKPYEATNYDISLEWYNRQGSAISLGFFRKDITNLFDQETGFCPENSSNAIVDQLIGPIERITDEQGILTGCQQLTATIDDDGNEILRDVNITAPINIDDDIQVQGFELAIQQKLDFLPYPWNGFGGVFNYTRIEQEGSEVQLSRVSPESYNLIGYWENDGISLRLAYNWRDDQILRGANSFLGLNARTRAAQGRLDFVGSYKVSRNTRVFLRGFNLTDEVGEEFLGTDDRAVSRITYTGRVYQLAVNYRF